MKRLLRKYAQNVFDGKITTLIGLCLVGTGIYHAIKGISYMEAAGFILLGLSIAGLKDPSIGSKPPQP